MFDALVIGGGPAGLQAALTLGRMLVHPELSQAAPFAELVAAAAGLIAAASVVRLLAAESESGRGRP